MEAVLESTRRIKPDDTSEAAKAARQVAVGLTSTADAIPFDEAKGYGAVFDNGH
jgi:hypothetical protein